MSILDSIESVMLNKNLALRFRDNMGHLISPVMLITGFRFSKDYRHGVSTRHRIVYAFLDTIQANWSAGYLANKFGIKQ